MEELNKYYEVIVFTASHSCYANPVIDYLDPERKFVKARLFRYYFLSFLKNRENCSQLAAGVYTKDLRIIQNRKLEDLILVDNSTYSFILQLDNGIPIIPFYNNKHDMVSFFFLINIKELYKLRDLMISMHKIEDSQEHLSQVFKWKTCLKYTQYASKLLNQLFA